MGKYENLFDLTEMRAVVVGGAGGIGQAVSEALASYGAEVAVTSRNRENLEKNQSEILKSSGKEVQIYVCDVSSEQSVIDLAAQIKSDMGGVDILVNSMGLNKKAPSEAQPMAEWDAMFQTNVRGLMLCCREFGKMMIEQRFGRIINIGSIGAIRNTTDGISTGYGATKGAVDAITAALAVGWAKYNISVNAICPIMTETPMMTSVFASNPMLKERMEKKIPMGRLGKVEDIAPIAVFLASRNTGFITGQNIYPDGGLRSVQ